MAHVALYDYGLLFPFLFSLQSTPGSSPLAMAIMPRPMRRALVGSISSTHRRLCPTQWSTSPRTWPTLRSIRRFPRANDPAIKKVLEFSKSGSVWCEGHWMIFQLQIFGIRTFFMIIFISFSDATSARRSLKGLATQGRRTHTVVSSHWAASTMALAATTMAALRCPRDGLPTSSILFGSSEPRKQF